MLASKIKFILKVYKIWITIKNFCTFFIEKKVLLENFLMKVVFFYQSFKISFTQILILLLSLDYSFYLIDYYLNIKFNIFLTLKTVWYKSNM